MTNPDERIPEDAAARRFGQLEARVAKLEARLFGEAEDFSGAGPAPIEAAAKSGHMEEDLEFEVGQNWFAVAGILALAFGAAFMLSLPYPRLPAGVPALVGGAAAAGLFALARAWRRASELVAGYLRGAGMALLFFATLRLYFFGAQHALNIGSFAGRTPLVLIVALNLAIGWRRKSAWLTGLALMTGYAAALAVGSAWFVLGSVALLSALAVAATLRAHWARLRVVAMALSYGTYLLWAIGNPCLGGALEFTNAPALAPAFVLVVAAIFAAGACLRPNRPTEDASTCIGALLNCGLGYPLFLVHTVAAFAPRLAVAQGLASVVFLGLAILFWMRERSHVSTFFYAITGYAALSLAIIKASVVPEVFVFLSLQSVVVVATAVWFRSRFIVLANFLIFVAVILGYVVVAERETGISIGFGIVALVSARILNWQKDRLELKTELMRNAYLVSAFLVLPYALHHLVPGKYVGLAWVGLALVYYVLNLVVQNRKYRWMGHATLLLTTCYLAVVGTRRFEPVYRIVSFFVLGIVLLLVSLSFTWWRVRQRARPARPSEG
jgi:hypothetical protein